jgi:hypothetical protein
MNNKTALIDKRQMDSNTVQPPASELRAAQALFRGNRAQGLAALNSLFRRGTPPEPALDGPYQGEMIALDIAPGLTQFFQWLTNKWMPWRGKTFRASQQRGDNIFTKDSYFLARLFNPLYRGFVGDGPKTYRGFAFRTYLAPGLVDADRTVLKIDYDLKENPSLTVRRVLDELVQLDDNLYLGKAHVRWWWRPASDWQTVAYFSLSRE